MIKMIATDVDGTLVKESSREVYPELFDSIRALVDQGVYFVIASGRQYGSISKMFAGAERELYYIAENGAHILKGEKTIGLTKMKREDVEEIMQDLRKYYPSCHVVASAPEGSFLESRDKAFIDLIKNQYRNEVTLVEDILKSDVEYVKLAIYQKGSIRQLGESNLIPKWEKRVKTCMAGEEWVDFMDYSVDKGNALKVLQKQLHILPEETMVFGDNANDVGMIRAAGESYAVENAVAAVKEAAKHSCPSYLKKGVYQILQQELDRRR